MVRLLLFLLFCIVFIASLFSQSVFFNGLHLDTDNGLSQNSVWDVIRTNDGYVWIGTASGITRWDGKNFVYYSNNASGKNYLDGDTRFYFYEDKYSNLWVLHNKGLSIYEPYKDAFKSILFKNNFNIRLLFSDDKYLYLLTDTNEISVLELKNKLLVRKKKTKILLETIQYNQNNICDIYKGIKDFRILYEEKNKNLIFIDKDTIIVIKCKKHIGSIFHYNANQNILFSEDSVHIVAFNNKKINKRSKKYPLVSAKLMAFYFDTVRNEFYNLFQDVLIVTDTNFSIKEKIINFSDNKMYEEFFYGIYHDKNNNYYVYTNTNGVYVFPVMRRRFEYLKTEFKKFNMIKSICKTNDGKIITGQYGSWLTIYKDDKYDTINLNLKEIYPEVLAIENYDKNHILAINSQCYFIFNHHNRKIVHLKKFQNERNLAYPSIKKRRGFFYFNVEGSLDSSYILKLKDIIKFDSDTLFKISHQDITCFEWINDSIMLIGTNKHLIGYNFVDKRFIFTKNFWVKNISKYHNEIYIGTTQGLFRINSKGQLFEKIQSLPDNLIYGSLIDKKGYLWCSHNKGLSRINLRTKEVQNYSTKDGLLSNEFNTGAFYRDDKGVFYFGNINGVNYFIPEKINQIKYNISINININQLLVNDEPYNPDTNINFKEHLILDFNHNTFSIDFNAIDISNTGKNTYLYYLEGYDDMPIKSGEKHFARYTKLSPGTYTLHLRTANANGVFGNEKKIYISIIPPFWKTNWFYVTSVMLGISILLGINHLLRKIQKQKLLREFEVQKKLENERIRISRDLHDNIGAQLTFLKNNIEWLNEHFEEIQSDKSILDKYLSTLSSYSTDVLLSLKNTIWVLHSSNVTITEIFDRLKVYCKYLKNNINTSCEFYFEENITSDKGIPSSISVNIFRMVQEVVHNALKHSQCTMIKIQLQQNKNKEYTIIINDNGKGFDIEAALKSNSYGLKNIFFRAEESGIKVSIQSNKLKGTKFEILIP
ncbi:MAG: two-component regulator propeller domain-containing protein [Bacteroidota bacterium]